MFRPKRVYEAASPADGIRVLVDRLWPRGITRDKAAVDQWLKEIAPSDRLRRWFSHDPSKWEEFKKRYERELKGKRELVEELRAASRRHTVALLYAAADTEHNNAVALAEILKNED
jgi:uncharacterized protein YeaO (DUF488 family)